MFRHYIYFTDEEKERARHTDIVELLRSQGEKIKRAGSEYEWMDGTQKVTIRGYLWYHQYEQKGGDAIDFVRRFYNKDYPDAMKYLLGGNIGAITKAPPNNKISKPFRLPQQNDNMCKIFAYLLKQRGISCKVLTTFVDANLIYESKKYHNAVFVGYDAKGIARHAHKRGTFFGSSYKGNVAGSLPEFSFHWNGTSNCIYLFEAPIDMLSFISMYQDDWEQHTYAASCSVSDQVLFQCLLDNPNINKVFLCFDNDEPGQMAVKRINEKLYSQGIETEILVPVQKDWNEDLLYKKGMEEVVCGLQQI